jgi:hypothetical protein
MDMVDVGIKVFAVLGAGLFVWAVGKYGVKPVFSKIYSWFTSASSIEQSLVSRVEGLEANVAALFGHTGATPVVPVKPVPAKVVAPSTGPSGTNATPASPAT